MPSAADHRTQAGDNEAFYTLLGGSGAPQSDWAYTVLFYVAVHEIQAFLVDKSKVVGFRVPRKHDERKAILAGYPAWLTLFSLYSNFLGWSIKTRYECYRPTKLDLQLGEQTLSMVRKEISAL